MRLSSHDLETIALMCMLSTALRLLLRRAKRFLQYRLRDHTVGYFAEAPVYYDNVSIGRETIGVKPNRTLFF